MATEDSGLKACPFCGGKARIDNYNDILCTECSATALYAEDWNRRSLPPGAVKGWVDKNNLSNFINSADEPLLSLWKIGGTGIRVLIVPIEEEQP